VRIDEVAVSTGAARAGLGSEAREIIANGSVAVNNGAAMSVDNPWLTIPLADYEAHMALAEVGQAQLLGDVFAAELRARSPSSVAVLGCAGGNGFEHAPRALRVVGVDVNADYVAAARARFAHKLPRLELHVADLERTELTLEPVDLVFAALVLEYVEPGAVLERIAGWLAPLGTLTAVLQLPSADAAEITPSPFTSLARLAPRLRLLSPERLVQIAARSGLRALDARTVTATGGKRFAVQSFARG
jgi:predicted TPR repeat methyltransferase